MLELMKQLIGFLGTIQPLILTLTLCVLFWYTIVTSGLRKQAAKQNEIAVMPFVVLVLGNNLICYKNIGAGTAFDICIDPITYDDVKHDNQLPSQMILKFVRLSYLEPQRTSLFYYLMERQGGFQHLCSGDWFNYRRQPGIKIKYKDMENNLYFSRFRLFAPTFAETDGLILLEETGKEVHGCIEPEPSDVDMKSDPGF